MIPAEAVEAAAKMLDPQTMGSGGALAEKFKEQTRAEARQILESAAPYIIAAALREAADQLEYGNPISEWLYEWADEIAPTDAV